MKYEDSDLYKQLEHIRQVEAELKKMASIMRCSQDDLVDRVQKMLDNIERMEKEKAVLLKKLEEQK